MSRNISTELKDIINGQSGKPVGVVNLYDTNFPYPSRGFKTEFFNTDRAGQLEIKHAVGERKTSYETIDTYPNRTSSYGKSLKDFNGDPYTYPENALRFNWGLSPPIGINPSDLLDQRRWAVRWTGYFYFEEPGTYQFGFVSTSLAQITVGNTIVASGISPNKILAGIGVDDPSNNSGIDKNQTIVIDTANVFLPIIVSFSRWNYNLSYSRDQENERFVALWKSSREQEWKIIDSSRVVPTFNFENTSGTLIDRIEIDLGGSEHPNTPIVPDAFPIELELRQDSKLYKNNIEWKANTSPIETDELGSNVIIHLSEDRKKGDSATIEAPGFLKPLVTGQGLPRVVSINEDHSSDRASTASFTVDVTDKKFDSNNITRDNCYTYHGLTESFGVLRKGRLVDIKMGYRTTENNGDVQRFRGFIESINVKHSADGSNRLEVSCIDLSKTIDDIQNKDLPDLLSYDTANLFESNPIVDGDVRPRTYDGWKLVDVIRDLAWRAGITSEQLFAKDSNGRFLIEDADDRFMRTVTYPFESRTLPEGDLTSNYLFQVSYGDNLWNKMQEAAEMFGRRLYFNMDGNLVLSRPNNPKILSNYSPSEFSDDGDEIVYQGVYNSIKSLRGFNYKVDSNSMTVHFRGVGIAIIVRRSLSNSKMKLQLSRGYLSSHVSDLTSFQTIDGRNVLDNVTNHRGSIEYISLLEEDGVYPITLEVLGETGEWYYKDGNHPRLGYNPSIIRVCDNLTYGDWTLRVSIGEENTTFYVEGFFVYKNNIYNPVRAYDNTKGNLSIASSDSSENMRNSVTIIGATIGGGERVEVTNNAETSVSRVNNTIVSKAVDIGSIRNPDLPNYLGKEKSITIINPAIRDKNRADFLAQYVLRRYKRNQRNPSIEVIGSPDIELHDCISVADADTGFESPIVIEQSGRADLFRENPDPLNRFWVSSISSSINEMGEYTSSIKATPLEPQPAYEPLEDPPESVYPRTEFITNLELSVDGNISNIYYNAYHEDTQGKYVKIEFDQVFNARRMWVKIKALEENDINDKDLENNSIEDKIIPNETLYTLLYEEGLIPHQHHTLFWNGWWATEDTGGSRGGGRYVPVDTKVYVEVYMERYSNGAAGVKTTHQLTELSEGIAQYSLTYVYMSNSDSGLYPGKILSANYQGLKSLLGSTINSGSVFAFDDTNNDYYGSVKTIATTNRPGGLYFTPAIYNVTYFSPTTVNNWVYRTYEKYIYPITGTLDGEVDVRDAGERVFFINPTSMITSDNSKGRLTYSVKLFGDRFNRQDFKTVPGRSKGIDIASGAQLYYAYYSKPEEVPESYNVFKLWLIRIPGAGEPDSSRVGFALIDKDRKVTASSSSDFWTIWQTSTNQYPLTYIPSDTITDPLGDDPNLEIVLSNIQVQQVK